MIGMDLKVTMDDGSEHIAPITYAVACAWEDHHPGKAAAAMPLDEAAADHEHERPGHERRRHRREGARAAAQGVP